MSGRANGRFDPRAAPLAVWMLDQAPDGGIAVGVSSSTAVFTFSKGCSGKLGEFVVLLNILHECCITRAWGPIVTWESAELKLPQHPQSITCVGLQVLLLPSGRCWEGNAA